jgi:large subunit ribosomal protein L24
MNLKKGDLVKIISGKDKGKTGKIIDVIAGSNKVAVEGLNISVRHTRPKKQGEKGQRIQIPKPLDASNVMFVCSKCNKPTRLNIKRLDGGKYARVCKKCKEALI